MEEKLNESLPVESNDVWVFLSHSHLDYDKVRNVRNILEMDNFRPIMFFLKCLEEDTEVNSLIKREIDARKRFVLCDSENARKSKWVQDEVEYIKSKGRMYETVNLDASPEDILRAIKRFEVRSTVYIYKSNFEEYEKVLRDKLKDADFKVYDYSEEKIQIREEFSSKYNKLLNDNGVYEPMPYDNESAEKLFGLPWYLVATEVFNAVKYTKLKSDPIIQEKIRKYEEDRVKNLLDVHRKENESIKDAEQKGFVIHFIGAPENGKIDNNLLKRLFELPKNHIIIKMTDFLTKRNKSKLHELIIKHPPLTGIGKTPDEVALMILDHIRELDSRIS